MAKNPKSPKTFEQFKKGTWKNESIGSFAKEEDFEHYKAKFDAATEAGKKRTAEAHGFDYTPKKEKKKE